MGCEYLRRLGDMRADRERGMVRIMSQSRYKSPISATFAIDLLSEQVAKTDHLFWPDDVSLRDNGWFNPDRILGPNQITDAYLLALAVKNDGRLVTSTVRSRSAPCGAPSRGIWSC